jgi:hypothetical protein
MPDADRRGAKVGAAVAFVFALGLAFLATLVLAIVGAPVGLVQAVAPLAAIFATIAFALLLGAPSLLGFAAVGGQAGIFAAALAFAMALGGVAFALNGSVQWPSAAPIAAGGAILALLVAPQARFGGVLSDVLATRIAFWPVRGAFALIFLAIGALTAMAGTTLAQNALGDALGASANITDALVGAALAMSVLTGGALSLVWIDAASAAFVALVIVATPALARLEVSLPGPNLPSAILPPTADWSWAILALLAAVATFAPSAIALGASGSRARALKIAVAGLAISLGALAFLTIAPAPLASLSLNLDPAKRTIVALVGLALARQGVFIATRAFGLDLRDDPQRIANTASARLARLRVVAVLLGIAVVMGARVAAQDPATLMTSALALSLGLTAPSLILALTTRGGSVASAVAVVVGLANFLRNGRLPHTLSDLTLTLAGEGAAAALVVGALAAWLLPDRSAQESVGDDLFD